MAHGVAVDVVPAREEDLALGTESGEPFGHVVPGKLADVRDSWRMSEPSAFIRKSVYACQRFE